MITSQAKFCVLASANISERLFAYGRSKFRPELQLVNMDYINSEDKKIVHGVVYKMPKLQEDFEAGSSLLYVEQWTMCRLLSVINLILFIYLF